MKKQFTYCAIFIVVCLALTAPVAAANLGGGISVVFQCQNVASSSSCTANGASVYINGNNMGTISSGAFEIPYDDSFSTYKITKDGYYDLTGSIPAPADGQTADIIIGADLTQKPTGSGKGWFAVHCDVDGATVAFNGVTKGTIANGVYTFEVSTTGTPYTSYSVTKSGYYTYSGSIASMPSDDQTIDLYPTLNPKPVTALPTTVSTTIGGSTGWYTIHCSVNGASVYFDKTYKGLISNGELSVMVYTTGTPYSAYSVSANGYVTSTGSLSSVPSAGQTKDIYVSLTPVVTTTVAPVGSEQGTYAVYCNVDGARVYFDNTYQGVISNGVLYVTVSTTATPFSTYRVEKTGYSSVSGTITRHPAGGDTVPIHATLTKSAVTTTTKTTAVPTTHTPLPLSVTLGAMIGAGALVLIAASRHKNR